MTFFITLGWDGLVWQEQALTSTDRFQKTTFAVALSSANLLTLRPRHRVGVNSATRWLELVDDTDRRVAICYRNFSAVRFAKPPQTIYDCISVRYLLSCIAKVPAKNCTLNVGTLTIRSSILSEVSHNTMLGAATMPGLHFQVSADKQHVPEVRFWLPFSGYMQHGKRPGRVGLKVSWSGGPSELDRVIESQSAFGQ